MSASFATTSQQHRKKLSSRSQLATFIPAAVRTVAATAVVAVGTYHLAKWAWSVYEENLRNQQLPFADADADAADDNYEYDNYDSSNAATTLTHTLEGDEREKETIIEESNAESVVLNSIRNDGVYHNAKDAFELAQIPTNTNENYKSSINQPTTLPLPPQPRSPSLSSSIPAETAHVNNLTGVLQSPLYSPNPNSSSASNNPPTWKIQRFQRMARCRNEANGALAGFLSSARHTIDARTETIHETRLLKKLRTAAMSHQQPPLKEQQDERVLWETIKVRSITRVMATVYTQTILFLALTVQVNLLGGRLFEKIYSDTQSSRIPSDRTNDSTFDHHLSASCYQASHRFVLTHTYEYFFAHGLNNLITAVEQAISEVLSNNYNNDDDVDDDDEWNVLSAKSLNFSVELLVSGISRVRVALEEDASRQVSASSSLSSSPPRKIHNQCKNLLVRFLLPSNNETANEIVVQDELARSILDETWDLLESPVLEDALSACLATTYDMLFSLHLRTLFEEIPLAATEGGEKGLNSGLVTKPLASVLIKLKKAANSLFDDNRDTPSVDSIPQATDALATLSHASQSIVNLTSSYRAIVEQLPAVRELADVSFG